MKSVIIIAIALTISIGVVLAITNQDFSDSKGLQNAIGECTNTIDSIGSSNLENCLDKAYYQ